MKELSLTLNQKDDTRMRRQTKLGKCSLQRANLHVVGTQAVMKRCPPLLPAQIRERLQFTGPC